MEDVNSWFPKNVRVLVYLYVCIKAFPSPVP